MLCASILPSLLNCYDFIRNVWNPVGAVRSSDFTNLLFSDAFYAKLRLQRVHWKHIEFNMYCDYSPKISKIKRQNKPMYPNVQEKLFFSDTNNSSSTTEIYWNEVNVRIVI